MLTDEQHAGDGNLVRAFGDGLGDGREDGKPQSRGEQAARVVFRQLICVERRKLQARVLAFAVHRLH